MKIPSFLKIYGYFFLVSCISGLLHLSLKSKIGLTFPTYQDSIFAVQIFQNPDLGIAQAFQ